MRRPYNAPRVLTVGAVVTLIVAGGATTSTQQGPAAINGSQPAAIDDTIEAGEADAVEPAAVVRPISSRLAFNCRCRADD